MAGLQANSALGRTRMARKPQGSSHSNHPSSTHPTSQASSSPSLSQIPTATSHINTFLSNLRLLNLDHHQDWPDITAATFHAKDSANQGQKRRIQCVEWALYRLFCLWDPEEARNKLQPYFPPLDQVQSLNLRAALLRFLEHVKKTGVLGRDAVVRRTMLDECKGERLEEVLSVFSSAVLKKVVSDDASERAYPALALTIALEQRSYSADRSELHALILAHKASLSGLLRDRTAARTRFNDFALILEAKEKSIARRKAGVEALKSRDQNGITDEEKLALWRILRNNWSGNERWMETILYGDIGSQRDGVLSAPFDRVWRRVRTGRVHELEDRNVGLLGQLDARAKAQRERLARWEKFRERLLPKSAETGHKERGPSSEHPDHQRGIDLGFGAHESLHLGGTSPRNGGAKPEPGGPQGEYAQILDSLNTELGKINNGQGLNLLRVLASQKVQQLPDEPLPEPEEELLPQPRKVSEEQNSQRRRASIVQAPGMASEYPEPSLRRQSRSSHITGNPRNVTKLSGVLSEESPKVSARRRPTFSETTSRRPAERPSRSRAATCNTTSPQTPYDPKTSQAKYPVFDAATPPLEIPLSPTQAQADEILASITNASPSPVKQRGRSTLSLAERAQLSMARNLRGDDEESRLTISPMKMAKRVNEAPAAEDDLVARTRRSMAGFEAAQQKAQLERRRSQKKSQRSQPRRETGLKSRFDNLEEEGDAHKATLIAEELMESTQQDYEAVFMSRPKIKTSSSPSHAGEKPTGEVEV